MRLSKKIKLTAIAAAVATAMFLTGICLANPVSGKAIASLDDVTSFSVQASGLRLVEPLGLQFTAKISKEEYNALKDKYGEALSFGVVVTTEAHLSEEVTAPSFESHTAGEDMLDIKNTIMLEDGDNMCFNAAVTNVKEENYNKKFVAAAYIKVEQTDSSPLYKYSSSASANFFEQVAKAQDNADMEYDEVQSEAFSQTIDSVVASFPDKDIVAKLVNEEVKAGDKLNVTATFEGVKLQPKFTSSDETVVRVTNGKLYAVRAGKADITVTASGKSQTLKDVTVKEADDVKTTLLNGYVTCNDDRVFAEIERETFSDGSVKPVIRITGGKGLPNFRTVSLHTEKSLTANTEYMLYARVKVAGDGGGMNLGWSFFISTNLEANKWTNLNVATGFGVDKISDDIDDAYYQAVLELKPTADVKNLVVKFDVHGTQVNSFDFTVADVYLVEKSKVEGGLSVSGVPTGVRSAFITHKSTYYYTVNPSETAATDSGVGIMFLRSAASGYHAKLSFKLNKGLTKDVSYTLKFKIIDFGKMAKNSYGEYYFTFAGIKQIPASYQGTSAPKTLQNYKNDKKVTSTIKNGVTVYEISVTDTASESVANAVFEVMLQQNLANQFMIADISLTEASN